MVTLVTWTSKHKIQDQDNVYIDYNLVEMFGKPVTNTAVRLSLAQDIIDKNLANISQGVDSSGRQYSGKAAEYTEGYKNSLEFQAYSKSDTPVDMKLTNQMLSSMSVLDHSPEVIRIGFSSSQSPKAHGHITGNVGKRRDFFGVPPKELSSLIREYKPRLPKELTPQEKELVRIEAQIQELQLGESTSPGAEVITLDFE